MISPYILVNRSSSNLSGFMVSCSARLSTMISSYSISGKRLATPRKVSRKSPSLIFRMLAL